MAIKVGDKAIFKGYSDLQEGQEPILIEGEEVDILAYDEEHQSYTVTAVSDAERSDSLFADEMTEIVAAQEEAKPARRTRAAASKDAPAEAPVEEKPAAKAKAAPKKANKAAPVKEAQTPAKAAPKAEAKPAVAAAPSKAITIIPSLEDYVGSHETALSSAKEYARNLSELKEKEEETIFLLGGLLAYIQSEKAYSVLGYEDFATYAEAEVGLKKRSAEYYARVYTDLTEAGVTVKDIEGIGWTKLRSLIGVIDKKNKSALLTKAKKMSRDDLADHMKEIKAKTGKASATSDAPAYMKFAAFRLHADQGATLETVINQAKEHFNTDNMAEAIFFMATDWSQAQDGDVPLESALAALNAKYGTAFEVEAEAPAQTEEAPKRARAGRR